MNSGGWQTRIRMIQRYVGFTIATSVALISLPTMLARADQGHEPLCVVVMDPLASQLSCPCVEGYAQRDYAALELTSSRGSGGP